MTPRFRAIAAVAAFCAAATAAQAQFVDERSPKPAPAVAGQATANAAAATAAVAPAEQQWVIKRGQPLHVQIEQWATKAGWQLYWRYDKAIFPPGDATFSGPFDKVLEQVVVQLFNEGKPVHLRIWEGNRVAEVTRSTPK